MFLSTEMPSFPNGQPVFGNQGFLAVCNNTHLGNCQRIIEKIKGWITTHQVRPTTYSTEIQGDDGEWLGGYISCLEIEFKQFKAYIEGKDNKSNDLKRAPQLEEHSLLVQDLILNELKMKEAILGENKKYISELQRKIISVRQESEQRQRIIEAQQETIASLNAKVAKYKARNKQNGC